MLFLGKDSLNEVAPTAITVSSYDSKTCETAKFNLTFSKATQLLRIPKVILYMSCADHNGMNVFIMLQKLSKRGKPLMHLNFPLAATPVKSVDEIPEKDQSSLNLHLGSVGILRVSHRAIDRSMSMHEQFPFHPHLIEKKITPGTIVELEIGIWAMGVDYEAAESIQAQVRSILTW